MAVEFRRRRRLQFSRRQRSGREEGPAGVAGEELRRQNRRLEAATLDERRDADANAGWRGKGTRVLAAARRRRQAAGCPSERLLRRSVREDLGRVEIQAARG